MSIISEFLDRHGLNPAALDPCVEAGKMVLHMKSALDGSIIDMPMVNTYLSFSGRIPEGKAAVVIDAGGTNFRCGLARFVDGKCCIGSVSTCKMPGIDAPATWDEFISFVADSIAPLLNEAEVIGFCFSYNAVITPDKDGIVETMDKEVKITGSEGKLIGASLLADLEKRGITGKRVIILNDTVAALLGGFANECAEDYSDVIGMICGTGFNTCCMVNSRLINMESGCYGGLPGGDVDAAVDADSLQPGEKLQEKKVSGAYLGLIFREAIKAAVTDGILSAAVLDRLAAIDRVDGSVVDAIACGEDRWSLFGNADELEFAKHLCLALFERSARCACTTILAILQMNDTGRNKPACICAEGSLIGRSRYFLDFLNRLLDRYVREESGIDCRILLGHDTTLPGSAAAALTN